MFWLSAVTSLLLMTNLLFAAESPSVEMTPSTSVIVVVGEPGEEKYEQLFVDWAAQWQQAASQSNSQFIGIGPPHSKSEDREDRELLKESLASLKESLPDTLWIVLIGHGTFDGKKARFNLRGTDITDVELSESLSPLGCRIAIINCASASAPFVNQLSATNRVVVSATQSGFEHNFARFGGYLAHAISDPSADLDKDGQTSLLEAWLSASKQTQEYYETKSQLATEHSLLDDNGDSKGTPADFFRGIHIVKAAKGESLPDGTFANQFILVPGEHATQLSEEMRTQRDQLERELVQLRQQKAEMSEEDYLSRLEGILIPLAKLYHQADAGKSK